VVAQCVTFLLAGYETTANALAFAVYCLARHPEAEARLLQEVDALAAAKGGGAGGGRLPALAPEDLASLPFTAAVIDEALRLYPPATAAIRHVEEPFSLGGHLVPAGCELVVLIWSLHRDPACWPDPLAFRPERWLPGGEALAARNPHAYMPFGGGARMCVGYKFALQVRRLGAPGSRELPAAASLALLRPWPC
jgi:thromboxane-A synthase/cytochrome P450 family 3 subfamily A